MAFKCVDAIRTIKIWPLLISLLFLRWLPDCDPVPDLLKNFLSYSPDFHYFLDLLKLAVRFAEIDDSLGHFLSDPGEFLKLSWWCSVDINLLCTRFLCGLDLWRKQKREHKRKDNTTNNTFDHKVSHGNLLSYFPNAISGPSERQLHLHYYQYIEEEAHEMKSITVYKTPFKMTTKVSQKMNGC